MSEEKTEGPYAHTKEGLPPDEWQSLDDHLRNVAGLAGGPCPEAPLCNTLFGLSAWRFTTD